MLIKPLIKNFIMPTKGDTQAGGFDIYMPTDGSVGGSFQFFDLGFATELAPGWAALLMPRSGVGAKHGLELNNTVGLIDSSYRQEWKAAIRTKSGIPFSWKAGERVLQFMIVPHYTGELILSEYLSESEREGGFGSTGK